MCSEWKMRAILALDLSADSALLKLRKIHHFQISGGMYIKLSEGATADKSSAIITHIFHSEHTDYTPTGRRRISGGFHALSALWAMIVDQHNLVMSNFERKSSIHAFSGINANFRKPIPTPTSTLLHGGRRGGIERATSRRWRRVAPVGISYYALHERSTKTTTDGGRDGRCGRRRGAGQGEKERERRRGRSVL